MQILDNIQQMRLIPLKDYTKIARVKWGNNDRFEFDENWISYGIDTQRSDLIVIDCDNKNDDRGVDNFLKMCADNNDDFPETFTVETPHGLHFYFKAPKDSNIKSSVSKLAKSVDVRAHGGYVVGPGSKVKDENGAVNEYIIENPDQEISEMPDWLLNNLLAIQPVQNDNDENSSVQIQKTRKKTTSSTTSKKQTNNKEEKDHDSEIERIDSLNWALEKMKNAAEGSRQSFLNHTSYFMGVKRVDKNQAHELVDIAIQNGLPENEAEITFTRSYADGLKEQNVPPLSAITKEFNTRTKTSFKDDPMDNEFYGHVSLSYNFWKKYGDTILFWQNDGRWYQYTEEQGYWNQMDDDLLRDVLKKFLEDLVLETRDKNKKLPTQIYREQTKLWQKATLEAVMTIARSDFINTNSNLFDANPLLINCKNGMVDLKTKEILEHDKKYFSRKKINVNYVPDISDTYCDRVLESIAPEEKDYLQLIAGQALTGEQPVVQAAFFLKGGGSNGKSTFIDLMLRTSGTYGKLQTPNVLQPEQNKEIYALSDFEGLRMAVVEELPDYKQLNSGALKRLVGTSRINSRRIYSENREFENFATLFVSCNKLPTVSETDTGTWRRLLVINFPYTYKRKQSEVNGPLDKLADSMVIYSAQRRQSTAEAFLAWRIEGAHRWAKNKNSERDIPESILQSVENWKEESDTLLSWFNHNIEYNPGNYCLTLDLLDCYNIWCSNLGKNTLTMKQFLNLFRNHPLYQQYSLLYKADTRPLASMKHSTYTNKITGEQRTVTNRGSFIQNIKFKDHDDNSRNESEKP